MTTLAAMWGNRALFSFAMLALSILASGLFASLAVPSAAAQTATDFRLTLDAGAPVDGRTDVVVSIDPGTSSIAALEAVLTYDSARVVPTRCVVLSELGACNTATLGTINLATVIADGWSVPTDVFQITFTTADPLHPQDVSLSVTEALSSTGDPISGTASPLPPVPGDVSCSRSLNILDAVLIAQHVVGTRAGVEGCPLTNSGSELNVVAADVNGSGNVSTADAVLIAQCIDGRANVLCPAE